jgi:uncharacterized membrane protein YidH (DUF202 family)
MAAREPRNRAAQVERTVLAWNRSSLAVAANGGLLAQEGFLRSSLTVIAIGLAVVTVGAIGWALSTGRYPRAGELRATHLFSGHGRVILAAWTFVVVLSVVDLMLVVTA